MAFPLPSVKQWEPLSGHLKSTGYLIFASGSAGLPREGLQRPFSLSQCHRGGTPPTPSTPPHPRLQLSHAVVTRTIKSRYGRYSAQGHSLPWKAHSASEDGNDALHGVRSTNWNEASKVSEWTWHAWISVSDSSCQKQWSQINTVVLMKGNVLALSQVRNSLTLRQVGRGKQLQPPASAPSTWP